MFSSVSWQSFFATCAIVSAVYYITVLLLCYSGTLWSFIRKRSRPHPGNLIMEDRPEDNLDEQPKIPDPLKKSILQLSMQSSRQSNRAEVVFALRNLVQAYPSLDDPRAQDALRIFARDCFRENSGLELDPAEMNLLWGT